jgi:hypothetical protein
MEPFRDPVPAISKPPLKLAVQLLKRWRDVAFKGRTNLAPSSIVLTTLAGRLYDGDTHPTEALLTILNGIHEWACAEPIRLRNPSNPKEWITDKWDGDAELYDAFLEAILDLRVRWQKLVREGQFPRMVQDLKALFDEAPVTKAFTRFGERRAEARVAGNLVAERATGVVSIRPAASVLPLAAAPAGRAIPVRDHTFHGQE